MKKKNWNMSVFLGVLSLLLLFPVTSEAVLKDVGPVDPANGFPTWYRDNTVNSVGGFPYGLPLSICLSTTVSPNPAGGYMCNLLPAAGFDPLQPIVFPTNFPDEVFWWVAEAGIDPPEAAIRTRLILALEGAFGTGAVTAGDQVSFARLRILITTPTDPSYAGTYTVTHPYGTNTFTLTADEVGVHAVFFTEDIGIVTGGIFTGALNGRIGPYLKCTNAPIVAPRFPGDPNPELYIGDPNVPCAITGSPFGTNFFRVQGPPGADLDGAGNSFIQLNQFSVTGKIRTEPIPSALTVKRATYARDNATTQIDVFAATDPISNTGVPSALQASVPGIAAPVPMAIDGAGNGFATIRVSNPFTLPATLTVTNTSDNPASLPAPSVTSALVDEVNVKHVDFDPFVSSLRIQAYSRDRLTPPTLASGADALDASGLLTVPIAAVPPHSATVDSSAGGTDTRPMSVVVPPIATILMSAPNSPQPPGTPVQFSAFGLGGSGAYEYQFWLRTGTTWAVMQPYSAASTWSWVPPAAGSYAIQVDIRNAGFPVAREASAVMTYFVVQ